MINPETVFIIYNELDEVVHQGTCGNFEMLLDNLKEGWYLIYGGQRYDFGYVPTNP